MPTVALVLGWLCAASFVATSFAGLVQDWIGDGTKAHRYHIRSAAWAIAAALMWLVSRGAP